MPANDPHTDGLNLSPFVIVALGHPAQPVERLIGLQAAVSRLIAWAAGLRLPRRRARTVHRTNPILANR